MSYHQNYYNSSNTSPQYGNNSSYGYPQTPGNNYSNQSSPLPSAVLSHSSYPVPAAPNSYSAQNPNTVPSPSTNRQMSAKAKIEKFIIRKSENSVIIRDLSFFCAEEHLHSLVSCYGECLKVHLCRSEEANHRSLLHAFVEMSDEQSILNLIEELDGVLYMGRQLKIQRCIGQLSMQEMMAMKQMKQGIQVHVRFESMEDRSHALVTEQRLRDIFCDCGAIEDAIVQRHSQNMWKQKGYGFLFFEDMESAERAVQTKNGVMFDNVYYSAAFTHKTKEKLQEFAVGMGASVDLSAVSQDQYHSRLASTLSMSRDEQFSSSVLFYTGEHGANTSQAEYYRAAAQGIPVTPEQFQPTAAANPPHPNRTGGGSGQPSPNIQSALTYSRSHDYYAESPIGANIKSQLPSPALSTYGSAPIAPTRSFAEDDATTAYYTSNESTPQHGYFAATGSGPGVVPQRRGTTCSGNSSDGYTTGNPSPAVSAAAFPHPFNRAFSVEGESSYGVGGIATGKEFVPTLSDLSSSASGPTASEGIALYSNAAVPLGK